METFLAALGLVSLAELGDKTMLATIAFATRYRARTVMLGVTVGAAVAMGASVAVGAVLRVSLPQGLLTAVAGVLFLVFAVATLVDRDDEDDEDALASTSGGRALLTISTTFGVAELGDKTMLATIGLAAQRGALLTWIGAVAALVAVNGAAVLVGRQLGERLPRDTIRRAAAAVFAAVGVWLLVQAGT